MTSPITPEMVKAAAPIILAFHADASIAWAQSYWRSSNQAEHTGDCAQAKVQGPITCDRCVCEEVRETTRAALEAALPSALAAAQAKGFAAGVEAAARVVEGAPVKEPNKIALVKYIRALRPRPPAAPAESEG